MRVVSGSARGIRLESVPGDTTRPILDRVKTALFDILRPDLQGIRMLDAFAGSGSVGIEALSQGAAHCTFLDIEPKAIATIERNIAATKFEAQSRVIRTDCFAFLRRAPDRFDLVFIAPPQYKQLWRLAVEHLAERPELIDESGLIIVQIDPKEYQPLELAAFKEESQRKYGNTLLVFYRKSEA